MGSLSIIRPTLAHFVLTPEELQWRAHDVLSGIADGSLAITISGTYALGDVAQAHRDLESRATSGKLLLRV
jgi:NADPH2:quinone reductase